ncbi:quinone oxidoreductase [Hymenobacter sp. BT664]|uniref:Quinone oxidoreductase n=1 Tax=Hymenobacter montanus TaxID=2771359 RepID=A0A927BEJ8_9BACT|nr:quinone oxidoreductase [Hymenobacter montanus]MBD2768629.1 quinone oxidoreductase [Hymenobacter montanus]
MKALCFDTFGGPDVLYYGDVPAPTAPDRGEVLVRTRAIGLNFADVYRRQGHYHLLGQPPFIAGYEGSGTIEAVGDAVPVLKVGDRVAFADVPFANAELVAAPADKIIPLPATISFELGAALLLQGLTAHYLSHDSYPVKPGDVVAVHAVAGGVGQLLTQLVRQRGGRVLGLTSSPEKAEVARQLGAEAVFLYADDWVSQLRAHTAGGGPDAIYDSVGSTLPQSLEAVKTRGTVVFYGMAGGSPAPVDPRYLMDASKTLTGGDLWNYLDSAQERQHRATVLFELVAAGQLQVHIARQFALADGAAAHRYLESRQSTGKVLLIP